MSVVKLKARKGIEALLHWTYREEMPKSIERSELWAGRGLPSGPSIFRMAALGTRVDEQMRDPGFPQGPHKPHPDALLIDHAVRSLEDDGIDWEHSRHSLLGHLQIYLGPYDAHLRHMQFQTGALIMAHAQMGTRPRWDLGPVSLKRIIGLNGKPVVQHIDDDGQLVEGRTKARHYGKAARCPMRLEPRAADIACARAEYSAWHAGLHKLVDYLKRACLNDHVALSPAAMPEPWITGEPAKPRILQQISA